MIEDGYILISYNISAIYRTKFTFVSYSKIISLTILFINNYIFIIVPINKKIFRFLRTKNINLI